MPIQSEPVPEWITQDYLQEMMRKYYEDSELILGEIEINPGSAPGDNFISQVLRIKVTIKTKNNEKRISIICKLMLPTIFYKTMKEKGFDIFENEGRMLSETLPTLHRKLGGDKFFPTTFSWDSNNEALFLEDLCEEGFRTVDRSCGLDIDHSLLVIETMAKMHAASWVLIEDNVIDKKTHDSYFFNKENGFMAERIVLAGYEALMKELPNWSIDENFKQRIANLKDCIVAKSYAASERRDKMNVIMHGDCWINNMMFKISGNKPVMVKFLDFQGSSYCPMVFDLLYFIYSSTSLQVRVEFLDTLLEKYYNTFISIAGEVFSYDEFIEEWKSRLFFGLAATLTFTPITMAPKGTKTVDLDDVLDGSSDNIAEKNIYNNQLYLDIITQTLPYFIKYNVL